MNVIGTFWQSDARLRRGASRWHQIDTPPVRVPARFIVCVQLGNSGRRGLSVAYDASSRGHSLIGVPGSATVPFTAGDWMIRVVVDRLEEHDPLRPPVKPPSVFERLDAQKSVDVRQTARPANTEP